MSGQDERYEEAQPSETERLPYEPPTIERFPPMKEVSFQSITPMTATAIVGD